MKKLSIFTLILALTVQFALFADHHEKAENPCNPCAGKMTKFHVYDNRDTLTFDSSAPLEKIVGRTSKITGMIAVNPNDITKVKASFELDLASMKTGIDLRDEHMRSADYLNTAKFPKAKLMINKITKVYADPKSKSKSKRKDLKKLTDGQSVLVDAKATLKLHGVKKEIDLKGVKISYFKESEMLKKGGLFGDILRISGGFSIMLPDYKIKVPQFLVLKLDEEIKINISLNATTVPPKKDAMNACNPCDPCNPCKGKKKATNPCDPCKGKKSKK